MRWTTLATVLAPLAAATTTVRAGRPLPEDPFDDAALPPSVRVAVEYIAYYLATACAPLTADY